LLEEAISVCTQIPDGKGGALPIPAGQGQDIQTIILRTSLIDLEDSVISKFRQSPWLTEGIAKFNEQKKIATFPSGATLRFGYASNMKDLNQYLGAGYAFIGLDEAGLIPSYKMWIALLGSLRCLHKGITARMAATANPGQIGHDWLKHLFVLKKPAPGMESHQYKASDYSYIPANYLDGPFAQDYDYIANLKAQPSAIRKAWIEGSWDIKAGAYFDCWHLNMTCGLASIGIQDWWEKWISIDWGFKHAATVYWHCSDEKGNVFTYRELIAKGTTGSTDLAEQIVSANGEDKIKAVYLSPDAWQKRDVNAFPIEQQIGAVLSKAGLPYPTRATDDRVAGAVLMYQMLSDGSWKIVDRCQELITAIPSLVMNPDKLEDVQKQDTVADDSYDGARYGILSHCKGRKSRKPAEVQHKEQLAKGKNPQHTYMLDLQWQAQQEENRKKLFLIGRIPNWRSRFRK
jgi:phage terminase large subunit